MSNLPPPANETQKQMAELFDKTCLDIVTKGASVEDADGKLVRSHPSAAMMNVIRGRIKDIGGGAVAGGAGSTSDDLVQQAMKRGISFEGKPIGPMPAGDDPAMEKDVG